MLISIQIQIALLFKKKEKKITLVCPKRFEYIYITYTFILRVMSSWSQGKVAEEEIKQQQQKS